MIKVYLTKQANYPVGAPKIKVRLKKFFENAGIVSDAEVNVSFVGKNKMIEVADRYLKEKNTVHNVLSFTESEAKKEFVYPADNIVRLGEIIVCYPKAFEEARSENRLIDDKVWELVEHGANHLLGRHHN